MATPVVEERRAPRNTTPSPMGPRTFATRVLSDVGAFEVKPKGVALRAARQLRTLCVHQLARLAQHRLACHTASARSASQSVRKPTMEFQLRVLGVTP
jgi:hypothetical protein